MDKSVLEKYIKAGKILQTTQKKARKSIKIGQKMIDIALKIEKNIKTLGGEPAFPANLSLNNHAAHYTPSADDGHVLGEDVMKVDIGVHVDGYIADAAFTLDFSGEYGEMVAASETALKDALAVVKEGAEIGEIGKAVEKAINAKGFNPIQNLSGHGLAQWMAHAQPSIANIDNGDDRIFNGGMVFAIEPFATDGKGFVKESPQSEIFGIDEPRPVRNMDARKILEFVMENYKTLPFAERWLIDELDMSEFKRRVAMRELLRSGCVKAFPILREEEGKTVTQAETSIALHKGKVIVLV